MAAADVVFVGRLVSSRVDPARLAPEFRDRQRKQLRRLAERLVDRRQRAAVAEQLDRYLASWGASVAGHLQGV